MVWNSSTTSAPEDGRNYRQIHVQLIGIINKPLLLHLVGCLYYCISNARSYKHQTDDDGSFLVLCICSRKDQIFVLICESFLISYVLLVVASC